MSDSENSKLNSTPKLANYTKGKGVTGVGQTFFFHNGPIHTEWEMVNFINRWIKWKPEMEMIFPGFRRKNSRSLSWKSHLLVLQLANELVQRVHNQLGHGLVVLGGALVLAVVLNEHPGDQQPSSSASFFFLKLVNFDEIFDCSIFEG